MVEALSLPLAGGTPSPTPDAPHNARAYELYLRANELARTYDGLARARDLYQQCLELDPRFAPAWAQLGRCHRVIGKYIDGRRPTATRAPRRPSAAPSSSTRGCRWRTSSTRNLEADIGQTQTALVRLLGEAGRHGNDPELFAGLVHACRYCGLFEQSIAAHDEARRLDPNVPTSFEQTLLLTGDIDRLLGRRAAGGRSPAATTGSASSALGLAGPPRRGASGAGGHAAGVAHPGLPVVDRTTCWPGSTAAPRTCSPASSPLGALEDQDDPEAIFQEGWLLCDVGEHEQGLESPAARGRQGLLRRSDAAAQPRSSTRCAAIPPSRRCWREAEAGRARALAAFREAGGERLLGA